uniref:Uncharacterized protein n=1 Tax=Arundo donax TaxID=35708 RepID=A0A0A9EDF8_ARUDO
MYLSYPDLQELKLCTACSLAGYHRLEQMFHSYNLLFPLEQLRYWYRHFLSLILVVEKMT